MPRFARLAAAVLMASAAFTVTPLIAADAPKDADSKAAEPAAPKVEEGFTAIFNGKDLTGWIYGKKKDKEGKETENKAGAGYAVKDGVIYCTKNDGGNLYTEKEYPNFILRFEFKLTPNANNGVGIRAPLTGDSAYQGMEVQVLDDSGSMYTKLEPGQYHGSVYKVFPAKRGSLKPVGEWNTEEIEANGPHIKVTLNGNVIVDGNIEDVKDPAVLKAHPGLQNKTGHIGFLGHGAEVQVRNLRIKELPEK
jgi:hypothetical protein